MKANTDKGHLIISYKEAATTVNDDLSVEPSKVAFSKE